MNNEYENFGFVHGVSRHIAIRGESAVEGEGGHDEVTYTRPC